MELGFAELEEIQQTAVAVRDFLASDLHVFVFRDHLIPDVIQHMEGES
jgi:hypothetical protein